MTIVFKDLQKLVSKQQAEITRKELFSRLQDKAFWIWDKEQHKQEDIRTDGDCCFNHQYLPEQYQVCLAALDTILKNAFVIMTKSDDNREKLQALQLFKDTHLVKLELLSNATTIDSTLNYIRSKQSQQQEERQKKHLTVDSTSDDDNSSDSHIAATTTTAVGRQSVF